MSGLTPKQEAFCQKYIETGNASEAYRQSYDAGNMKPESVSRKAFELLENGKITAHLETLKARQLKRHDVTIDRVLSEYAKLAFLDIRKAFDEQGNLKPVHELDDNTAAAIAGIDVVENLGGMTVSEDGVRRIDSFTKKVRLSDKRAALSDLAKYLGMFADAGVVVNVNTPLPSQDKALLDDYAKSES